MSNIPFTIMYTPLHTRTTPRVIFIPEHAYNAHNYYLGEVGSRRFSVIQKIHTFPVLWPQNYYLL